MSNRYTNLKKISSMPAARMLAEAGIKLKAKVATPGNAQVEAVLVDLDAQEAWVDMILLMSVVLPPRECVWWGCIAAREVTDGKDTPCLKASEAWVFEPNDANRSKIQVALDAVDLDDDTALLATAALYATGNLGPGDDVKDVPAPPSALSGCVFGMNMLTLETVEDANVQLQVILDRALEIARGGNGSLSKKGG